MRQLITKRQPKAIIKKWLFGALQYSRVGEVAVLLLLGMCIYARVDKMIALTLGDKVIANVHVNTIFIFGMRFKYA